MTSSYQDLNLREGASIGEIKAAFRHLAKTFHPDAAGNDPRNVENFIKVQSAYQKLMKKALAHNQARRRAASRNSETFGQRNRPAPKTAAENWRFESSREVGLDIHYRLSLLKPLDGAACRLRLPWQAREACPRCLGEGRTLAKVGQGDLYRPTTCAKCGGSGSLSRDSQLEVNITPEMIGRDKIRLRQAGLYQPRQAQRGDLILEIKWVDQLPDEH